MITPHILILSAFFSVVFGWHLLDALTDWRDALIVLRTSRRTGVSVRTAARDLSEKMRELLAALCLVSISASYLLRTAAVLLGLGDAIAGQVAFFALLGICIPASIFMVISRRWG